MIKVRKGTFETNSSSTHSICICKDLLPEPLPKEAYFGESYFGWEIGCLCYTHNYLFTAIMHYPIEEKRDEYLCKLKDILTKHDIKMIIEPPQYQSCGIDHCGILEEFLEDILNDPDKLLRFLFHPKSRIYTGNDNSCDETDDCWCAVPKILDENTYTMISNPKHDSEHFDYYFKDN